jgi:hypothetical protein
MREFSEGHGHREVDPIPTPYTIRDHMIEKHNGIHALHANSDQLVTHHIEEGHQGNTRRLGGDEDTPHVHSSTAVDDPIQNVPWQPRLPRWRRQNP